MSYSSYESIQPLNTYEEALKFVSKVPPIRGSDNVIPLGKRSYHQAFSIRKNGEAVECLMDKRPIVSFHSSGTITITSGLRNNANNWNYSDVTEAYFLKNLLRHYIADASMHKRTLRLTLVDGRKVALRAGEPLIAKPEGRCLTFVSDVKLRGWQLNRKACNSVRKQYGDFYRYMKGMVSLRKENISVGAFQNYQSVIAIHSSEMKLGIPEGLRSVRRAGHAANTWLTSKPIVGEVQKERWNHEAGLWERTPIYLYDNWVKHVEGFLTFVRDEGDTQHESWHKAFLMLAYSVQFRDVPVDWKNPSAGSTYICRAIDIPRVLDEIIFKWHSKEVFEMVTLEVGKVPNPEYEKWVDRYPKESS